MTIASQRKFRLLTFILVLPVLMGVCGASGAAFAAEKARVRLGIEANSSSFQDYLKQCIPKELEQLYNVEYVESGQGVDVLIAGQEIPNTNVFVVVATLAALQKISGEYKVKTAQTLVNGAKGEEGKMCRHLVGTPNFQDFLPRR
jgi:hypothetical protein